MAGAARTIRPRARNRDGARRRAAAHSRIAFGRHRRSGLRHRFDACARSSPAHQARQSWRLVDNDLSLLARAPAVRPARSHVTTVPIDLNRDLEAALDGPLDLVTTSALLDLVSDEWLERLAVEAAARRLPVYAALSYDGRADRSTRRIRWTSGDRRRGQPAPARDKGFGPALGPRRAQAAVDALPSGSAIRYAAAVGLGVRAGGPRHPDTRCCPAGRGRRARDRRVAADSMIAGSDAAAALSRCRAARRSASVTSTCSPARPARAEPTGRSRTDTSSSSWCTCIGARSASSTRSIGGKREARRGPSRG